MTSGRESAVGKALHRLPECYGYGVGVWSSVRVVG